MSDAVRISVLRKSQPVELELSEGEFVRYSIKELTGAQRDEYFNKTASRTNRDANGEVVSMKDYKGLYSTLLSFCLYDADSKLIPESKIQEWPDTAQKALFEIAIELNGLRIKKADEGSEKND
jgi:hypothetical protein